MQPKQKGGEISTMGMPMVPTIHDMGTIQKAIAIRSYHARGGSYAYEFSDGQVSYVHGPEDYFEESLSSGTYSFLQDSLNTEIKTIRNIAVCEHIDPEEQIREYEIPGSTFWITRYRKGYGQDVNNLSCFLTWLMSLPEESRPYFYTFSVDQGDDPWEDERDCDWCVYIPQWPREMCLMKMSPNSMDNPQGLVF